MYDQLIFMLKQAGGLFTYSLMVITALAGWYKLSEPFRQRVARVKAMPARLELVEAQLKTDHGMTMLDKVNDTQARMQLASDAILKALDRQALMQEALGLSTFETLADGQFSDVSPSLCRLLGCPALDLLGWCWTDKICESERVPVEVAWRSAVAQRKRFKREICFVCPDGDEFKAIVIGNPILGGGFNGLVIEAGAITRDAA